MEKFITNYSWIAGLSLLVLEYLIGKSKLKSNSTVEILENIVDLFLRSKTRAT